MPRLLAILRPRRLAVVRLLFLATIALAPAVYAQEKPNVIIIFADDIGIETIGAYGSEYETPHIDSLAENGVRFDHGYATPVCTTSRTRLLTGTYNFKHYKAFAHLDPTLYTIPQYLKDSGYDTCVVGKWQLAGNMEYGGVGAYPGDIGFDEYLVWQLERTLKGSRYWQPTLSENGVAKTYCKDDFAPTLLNDYLLDFIDRKGDSPFFALYNPVLAHDPWTTTPDSLDAETPKEKFRGMMAYLDKMVGRLLAKLDERGIAGNTLIFFIGDNGAHPQITSKRNGESIKGGKWLPIKAGVHVPYIVQWKEGLPRGVHREGLVEILDVFPTIVAAVGEPISVSMDGIDLAPHAHGKVSHPRDWIFMHYDPQWGSDYFNTAMPAARFLFNKQWKLYGDGRAYRIDLDPLESNELNIDSLSEADRSAYQSLRAAFENMNDGPLKPAYLNQSLKGSIPLPSPDCEE